MEEIKELIQEEIIEVTNTYIPEVQVNDVEAIKENNSFFVSINYTITTNRETDNITIEL